MTMFAKNPWLWLAVGVGALVLCNGDIRCAIRKTLRFAT
jgi:hypothetical protein